MKRRRDMQRQPAKRRAQQNQREHDTGRLVVTLVEHRDDAGAAEPEDREHDDDDKEYPLVLILRRARANRPA